MSTCEKNSSYYWRHTWFLVTVYYHNDSGRLGEAAFGSEDDSCDLHVASRLDGEIFFRKREYDKAKEKTKAVMSSSGVRGYALGTMRLTSCVTCSSQGSLLSLSSLVAVSAHHDSAPATVLVYASLQRGSLNGPS